MLTFVTNYTDSHKEQKMGKDIMAAIGRHMGAKHGTEEMVQDILTAMGGKSAKLWVKKNNDGWTALHGTVQSDAKRIVKAILGAVG